MTTETLNNFIVNVARRYIGVTEIKQNLGWEEKDFQEGMERVGWMSGMAWCMLYCEFVWSEAYFEAGHSPIVSKISQGFSASVMETWNKVRRQKLFRASNKPEKGAIAVWQNYIDEKPHWTGHSGIVMSFNENSFNCIEGNTNAVGSREGDTVAIRTRTYNFTSIKGLVLQGFILPKKVEVL